MKLKLSAILCSIFLFSVLFSFPVYATQTITLKEQDMTFSLPDDFVVLTANNLPQHQSLLEEYNTTVTATEVKFTQDHYQFMAISDTLECTVFLSASMDEVSATIGDLITYPDRDTAKALLLGKTPPKNAKIQEIEQRGALFYRVDFGVNQGIGRIAYITVFNGIHYTFCLVDTGGTLSKNVNSMFDTAFRSWEYKIHAETEKIQAFRQKLNTILFWVCVPVGLVFLGIIGKRMVKEFREKEQIRKRQKNIPKRPRR